MLSLYAGLLAQSGNTLYDALGVTHDCTEAALKAAYRRCALKHHPDKVRGSAEKRDASRRFERINQAYSTLIDPASRQQYNSELMHSAGSVPRHHYAQSPQQRSVVRLNTSNSQKDCRPVAPCHAKPSGHPRSISKRARTHVMPHTGAHIRAVHARGARRLERGQCRREQCARRLASTRQILASLRASNPNSTEAGSIC